MQRRVSLGLHAAARRCVQLSSCASIPPIAHSTSSTSLCAVNCRFLSAAPAVIEPLKLEHCAHRRTTRATLSNEQSRTKTMGSISKFNVHRYVVQQQMPLEEVLPLVQNEVRAKTLKVPVARQAVDSFYFHCAQEAEEKGLSDVFRRELLRYFDEELFVYGDEEQTKPFVLGKSLNEAVFGSVIKLHLAGGDTEAAWMLINKLRRAVWETSSTEAPKLHFRTVSPLLEYECRHDQFGSAYSRWQHLKQHDVEWTSAMEDVLVQMVIACVKTYEQQSIVYTKTSKIDASELPFHIQMTSLLHDLQLTCREVSPSNAELLLHAFNEAGYSVKIVPSDAHMRSQCPSCRHTLSKQGMSKAERELMLAAIDSRLSKASPQNTVKEYLEPFRDWLMLRHENFQLENLAQDHTCSRKPLHYVLDGPNIAYINQNFGAGTYRLDQVDAVARELQAQGHLVSITMPSAYLADKFVVRIRTKHFKAMRRQGKFVTRERTPEEKAIMARWYAEDMIYSCRTDFLSDDLFWLYASVLMGCEGRVVTNDQGRDHVFALLNGCTSTNAIARTQTNGKKSAIDASLRTGVPSISMDLVARWKDMTTVKIEIKHDDTALAAGDLTALMPIESIRLCHPQPFSRVPQVTALQHFHFPIADQANQNEHPNQAQHPRKRTRWLCAYFKDVTN